MSLGRHCIVIFVFPSGRHCIVIFMFPLLFPDYLSKLFTVLEKLIFKGDIEKYHFLGGNSASAIF